jgi:hypothetical protein
MRRAFARTERSLMPSAHTGDSLRLFLAARLTALMLVTFGGVILAAYWNEL